MMSQRFKAIRLGLMLVAACVAGKVLAHHSFAAIYNEDQSISIEGTVLAFLFRNPHTFIHVQAPDDNGDLQRWAVEWASPTQLTGQGVGTGTLRPGDVIRVTGAPGRNPEDHRLVLRHLIRPADGYEYGNDPNETFD